MEESDQDVQQIASQLEEAALTNVTEASTSKIVEPPAPLPNLSTAPSQLIGTSSLPQMPPIPQMTPELRPTITPSPLQQTSSATPSRVSNTKDVTPPPPVTGFVPSSNTIAASLPTSGSYSQNAASPPPTFTPEAPAPGPQTSIGSYGQTMENIPSHPPIGGHSAQFSPPPMQTPYQASQAIDFSAVPDNNLRPSSQQNDGFLGGWLSGNFMNKVVEKAKYASETVITTLDPGMKQVLNAGGTLNLLVSSSDNRVIEAVRQGFQSEFNASIKGHATFSISAVQIIGYSAAMKSIEQKIEGLRKSGETCQLYLAFDNFLAEQLPDKWFDLGVLYLRDDSRNIDISTFTPGFPIETDDVLRAQDMTPATYDLRWSGLSTGIDQILKMKGSLSTDWRKDLFGSSLYETVFHAAKNLAHMYKRKLHIQ